MTVTRERSWRSMVIQGDPNWPRDSQVAPEYEFNAPTPRRETEYRRWEHGRLTFYRRYTDSAIYSTEWNTS
jgi:hypothetical protein